MDPNLFKVSCFVLLKVEFFKFEEISVFTVLILEKCHAMVGKCEKNFIFQVVSILHDFFKILCEVIPEIKI